MIISGGVVTKSPNTVWTGTPPTWGTWPSSLNIANRWVSYPEMYRRQVWVRTCVDKRAALLARLPLKVYRHDDLNRPEEPDHPYARLLARPNRRNSRSQFWLWVQTTFDIYGEAFIGKVRDGAGRPVELVPLWPASMHEVEERDGRVIWDFDNGKVRISGIGDEDLIHPRNYNPESHTRGLSKMESLRATLENEDAALRAQSSFWRRGARPGVALTHPGKLSQPAADRLKLRWEQVAAGADNTGTTVVLEEGMKPELMQLNAEEAQYIEGRRLNREEVIAIYDVPPPAVHDNTHSTYSNIVEQMRSVYRDTMAPILIAHESELETQLRGSVRPGASAPDFSGEVYAEFLLDGVLRGDFEERADAYQKGINSAVYTPAEVRKLENLPFIEGSDVLLINSTMVRLDVAGEPAEDVPDNVVPLEAVRTVMGRLSRQKTVDDIDGDALVAGLNGAGSLVLAELEAAKAAGEPVAALRARLKALGTPAVSDRHLDLLEALVAKEAPPPPPPIINVDARTNVNVPPAEPPVTNVTVPESGPRSRTIERDEAGNIARIVEEG